MKILFMIVLSALNVYSQQRLDQYIDYGQNNNADVQEAYDQWQAAMEDVSVVKNCRIHP